MNAHPEAAGRLSPALREDSTVPWARVIAFRNRLIHGYWSIDLHLVWDVIENELPTLNCNENERFAPVAVAGAAMPHD